MALDPVMGIYAVVHLRMTREKCSIAQICKNRMQPPKKLCRLVHCDNDRNTSARIICTKECLCGFAKRFITIGKMLMLME